MTYVGQSINVEKRYNDHVRDLSNNKHHNHKVQNSYDAFGTPKFKLLDTCDIDQLNDAEYNWINDLDTIREDLNLVSGGASGFGPNAGRSKYSMMQILKAFGLLRRHAHTYKEIALRLDAHPDFVRDIGRGHAHSWLSGYGERYDAMLLLHKTPKKPWIPVNASFGTHLKTGGQHLPSSTTNFIVLYDL